MVARLLTVLTLAAGIVAVATVLLGAGSAYTVTARFENAGQLVRGNQVRMGAATVGEVRRIRLDDDGLAVVTLRLEDRVAPLPEGTVARIRLNSLAGVANRYVALDVPPERPGAATVADGGELPVAQTQSAVDLDAVLAALDAPTREGLGRLIRGGATHLDGRTLEARRSLELLAPALNGVSGVARELTRDDRTFRALLTEGAAAASALASRRDDLADLVTHAESTARAVADERAALQRGVEQLPGTLRRARVTFAGLRTTFDALDPLVSTALPATRRLAPFLTRLDDLAGAAGEPVRRLTTLVAQRGAGNDLTDLAGAAPGLARLARTAFPRAIRTMDDATGPIADLRAYTPDVVGTAARLGQVSAGYDANGHYARVQPAFYGLRYDAATGRLEQETSDRLARVAGGNAGRCPGGILRALADESAPWPVVRCNLSSTPPVR